MRVDRPAVWFERAVPPDLAGEVEEAVVVLGPTGATPEDPHAMLAGARGAVVGADEYGAAVMDRGPHLRVIARTGIGYDRVDVEAATARGIAVCNAPDGPTVSTAEHTVTLMMAAAKGIKPSAEALRRGEDDLFARHRGVELDGKTLGLVGFGRIARRVARIAGAIGMRVTAYDPFLDDGAFPPDIRRAATLEDALDSDVVSVHVPLTPENRGLIGAAALAVIKPGAVFVNTARGGLVDHAELLAALDDGRVFAAGLDVSDPEPLPADHLLLHREDVIVTPHVAAGTAEAKVRLLRIAFHQVLQVLRGERPDHLVNPEVWDRVRSGAA